jgi:hypothetical protein
MKALIVREMAFRDQIAHADVDRLVEEVRRSGRARRRAWPRASPAANRASGGASHGDPPESPGRAGRPRPSKGRLPGQLCVYQLADAGGLVVYNLGLFARRGASLVGLRSVLERCAEGSNRRRRTLPL